MKEVFGGLAVLVLFVVTLGALSMGGGVMSIKFKEFFGVWNADVDRKIFDNTKSQVQGTIQALSTYKLQYETASTNGHKKAFREAILLEYNAFNRKDLLPQNLRTFINSL